MLTSEQCTSFTIANTTTQTSTSGPGSPEEAQGDEMTNCGYTRCGPRGGAAL